MPFSYYALDEFFSQEISQLNACNAALIRHKFPESEHWVGNFFLNSIFTNPIDQKARAFGFGFLRRAETAFMEYEIARNFLDDFVKHKTGKPSSYLKALTHFEIAITMIYQSYQLVLKISDKNLFQKNDRSVLDRLNKIYNLIRHFDPSELPPKHFHPMWITNDGVQVESCSLTFEEIENTMIEIGNFADKVSSIRRD
jgi:hypothetical protein